MDLLDERQIQILENLHFPNTYWKGKTKEYRYWFRSLLQKIDSSLIFQGLPSGWSDDFFHLCLWAFGFVAVFETSRTDLKKFGEGGILFQPCTLGGGFDFYYQPKKVIVANPMYTKELTVGKDCEILKLTPDFWGIFDIIDFYATKLAEISKGIDMGLINTKMPVILSASNDAQSETLKKIYDSVQAGNPLVVYKNTDGDEIIPSKEPFEVWNQDFRQTYIVHNLLEDMQLILDSFYTEIGLPVAIEKKERLVTSEADFASAQSQARISCWVQTLEESFEKIENTFGLHMEVKYAAQENDVDGDGNVSQSEDTISKYKR
ncbi:MAG: hypothetical protein VZR53_08860 [Prevotella sp.]|nr:hypothetical protein [Prevotella sp.]